MKKVSIIWLVFLIGLSGLWNNSSIFERAQAAEVEPYLGEIRLFPYNAIPRGWMPARGQSMSITQNTALYSLLGNNYGGDGKTTFSLPNLSGAAPDGTGYYIAIKGIFPSRDESIYSAVPSVLGEVRIFPYGFTPPGFLAANGQEVSKSTYSGLYEMIGTTYGGDGSTTFKLPNMPKMNDIIFYAISTDPTLKAENGTGNEYIGEIIPMLVSLPTNRWIPANGLTLPINQNQALFSLLGTKFGGDGQVNFNVPNLNSSQSALVYYVANTGVFPTLEGGELPEAIEDNYITNQNTPLIISAPGVLSNDRAASTAILRSGPMHGLVVMNSNGSFTYTPMTDYVGTDSFTYSAYNEWGESIPVAVTLTIEQTTAPVISNVTEGGMYNQAVTPRFNSGTALLNGAPFTSGTTVTADGDYTLEVTNSIGTTTIHFTVDTHPPIVAGVTQNGVYTISPVITFNEGTATLSGFPFNSGDTVQTEGEHVLIVTDRAGNTTTVRFSFHAPRTIHFDSNGGSEVPEQNVNYGDKTNKPDDPTKVGHTFAGWFTDSGLSQAFDFDNTPVTGDLTLYAKWTADKYTISFDTLGGSTVDDVSVEHGSKLTAPASPSRSGYTFSGWYVDAELKTPFDFDQTEMTADLTLYAKWNVIPSPLSGGNGNNSGGSGSQNSNGSSNNSSSSSSANSSTNGRLTLAPGQAGQVSSGNGVTLTIPAGAMNQELKITIDPVEGTSDLLTNQTQLLSPVYELLKNVTQNFDKPVTLKMAFDGSSLRSNQRAELFYFDEQDKKWLSAGESSMDGDLIQVDVNHFTKFAVFAVDQPNAPVEVTLHDINGHWAEEFIQQAVRDGIVKGYVDGSFKPNASVTRAEFTVMLMNALHTDSDYAEAPLSFTDRSNIGAWAQSAIARAVQAGFIQGDSGGSFRPNDAVTRAEMAVMVANALQLKAESGTSSTFADNEQIPVWARAAVAGMQQSGLLNGKGLNTFAPRDNTTRAEAVKLLMSMPN
ncbi:tail fiber protein [Paenibacillus illinoisensis]|uniref:tail fiber protein n=1 Tax=Paenibacillus illinoisensis TaxID=59845 RepID=UPI0021ADA016|nr:tail fiber protein [Paenibacillus illinoisensis]